MTGNVTGKVLIDVVQAAPHRELEIEPVRVPQPIRGCPGDSGDTRPLEAQQSLLPLTGSGERLYDSAILHKLRDEWERQSSGDEESRN